MAITITNNSYLEGFSINDGRADYPSNEWTAIGNDNFTTISNIYIKNVWSGVTGPAGIDVFYVTGGFCYATLDNCDFESTSGGGWDTFFIGNGGAFTIRNSRFVTIGPNGAGAGNANISRNIVAATTANIFTNNLLLLDNDTFIASNTNSVNIQLAGANTAWRLIMHGCTVLNTNAGGGPLMTNIVVAVSTNNGRFGCVNMSACTVEPTNLFFSGNGQIQYNVNCLGSGMGTTVGGAFTLATNSIQPGTNLGFGSLWMSNYDLWLVTPFKTNRIIQGQ
jgi:hypothetical protein